MRINKGASQHTGELPGIYERLYMFPSTFYLDLARDLRAIEVSGSLTEMRARFPVLDRIAKASEDYSFEGPAAFEMRTRTITDSVCECLADTPAVVLWLSHHATESEVQELPYTRPTVRRARSNDLLECRTVLEWMPENCRFQVPTAGFRIFSPRLSHQQFVLCVASRHWVAMRAMSLDDDLQLDLQLSALRSESRYRPHAEFDTNAIAEALESREFGFTEKYNTNIQRVWMRRQHLALL